MNSSITKFEKLPTELLLQVSYFLDIDSFISFRNTCKKIFVEVHSTKFVSTFLKHNPMLRAINIDPSPSDAQRFLNLVFRKLAYQFYSRSGSSPDSLEIEAVVASTTDRNQFVYLTEESHGFWSSLGTPDDNREEYLLYRLNSDLAIPTLVFIEFAFFSQFHNGSSVFPSKYVQIEFSFVPSKPFFVTPKYELKGEIKDRTIEIPILPNVIAARYMKVKFFGMQNRNVRKDNLFYICVDTVICFGYKVEKTEKKASFGGLIHQSVQNHYAKMVNKNQPKSRAESMEEEQKIEIFNKSQMDGLMIDENEEEEALELINIGYDIERHNQLLLKAFKAESKKNLINFVSKNQHLLDSEQFFKFLMENEGLGELYLIEKAKKCNFLNPQEIQLYLQLTFELNELNCKNVGSPIQISNRKKKTYLRELFSAFVIKSGVIQRFLIRLLGLQDKIQDPLCDDNSLIICSNKGLIEIIKKIITGIQREMIKF